MNQTTRTDLLNRAIVNLRIANVSRTLAASCDKRGDIASAREHRKTASKAEATAKRLSARAEPAKDYAAMANALLAEMIASGYNLSR